MKCGFRFHPYYGDVDAPNSDVGFPCPAEALPGSQFCELHGGRDPYGEEDQVGGYAVLGWAVAIALCVAFCLWMVLAHPEWSW